MAKKKKEELEVTKDYSPLTESEYVELIEHLNGIKNYLPEHLMTPFWNWCNRIRAEKTPQPCSCKSSARHWASCVETLRKFVKERE